MATSPMTVRPIISATSRLEPSPTSSKARRSLLGLFSQGIYVAVEGIAELIRNKAALKEHWTSGLDKWFDDGGDTPGIVLIKVKAKLQGAK